MLTSAEIRSAIPLAFDEVSLPGLTAERGQVRDNHALADGRRIGIATDRFTIFEQQVGLVPYQARLSTSFLRGGSSRPPTSRQTTRSTSPTRT